MEAQRKILMSISMQYDSKSMRKYVIPKTKRCTEKIKMNKATGTWFFQNFVKYIFVNW